MSPHLFLYACQVGGRLIKNSQSGGGVADLELETPKMHVSLFAGGKCVQFCGDLADSSQTWHTASIRCQCLACKDSHGSLQLCACNGLHGLRPQSCDNVGTRNRCPLGLGEQSPHILFAIPAKLEGD